MEGFTPDNLRKMLHYKNVHGVFLIKGLKTYTFAWLSTE